MHIRGGKSDIFGSEYYQSDIFWVQIKLKRCSRYFLTSNIVILIFLGLLEAILTSICICSGHFIFMYWFLSRNRGVREPLGEERIVTGKMYRGPKGAVPGTRWPSTQYHCDQYPVP